MTIADVLTGRARWCVVEADCLEVLPCLPDAGVAHVITDPPYTQQTSKNARRARRGKTLTECCEPFITFGGVDGVEGTIAGEAVRVARRWAVIFCALEQLATYKEAAGDTFLRSTAWLRTNSAPQFTGDRPGQALEGIAVCHRKGRKRWNRGGDCWAPVGPTANSLGEKDKGVGHPTPKPIWLMTECLEAFTDPDEIILDPFCGSGTTGVAALRLGRRFIGIEKDAKYAAIARERLAAESQGLSLRDARAGQISLFA